MTAPYGTAYVRILADVSKFPEDLRKKMQEGVDKASRDQRWDEFEGSAEKAGGRAGRKAGTELVDEAEKETRSGRSKAKMRQAGENAAREAGGGFLTKLRSIVLGPVGMYGLLGAAAAGILGSGQSLVPAALAAIPALATAAAGSIGTLVFALHGFTEAVGAGIAGDTEKFNEALAKLAPSARSVAREIVGLTGVFSGLQQSIQQAFFAQLTGDFASLAHKLLPILKAQLPALAETLGGLFSSLLGGIGDSAGPIGIILDELNNGLTPFIPLLHDLVTTFFRVGEAAAPFLTAISKSLAGNLGDFLAKLNDSLGSGGVVRFFETAGRFLADLGGPIGELLGLFGDILDAFAELGSPTLTFLSILAGILRNVLAPILPPLAKFLGGVLSGVGTLLAALTPGLVAVGDALGQFFTALSDQLPSLIEALTPLFDDFALFLQAVAPDLAAYLVGLATNIIPILVDVLKDLAPLWAAMTPVLTQLAKELLPLIPPLMKAWFDVLADFVPLLPALVEFFKAWLPLLEEIIPLLPKLIELWTGMLVILDALLSVLIPIISAVVRFIAAWDKFAIGDIVIPQIRGIVKVIGDLTGAIDDLLRKMNLLPNSRKFDTLDRTPNGTTPPSGSRGFKAFATGGMVWHPTRALIGENEPEAVIPMGSPDKARAVASRVGLLSMIGTAGTGGFAGIVNVYLGTRDLIEFTDKRVEAKMDDAAGELAGARG